MVDEVVGDDASDPLEVAVVDGGEDGVGRSYESPRRDEQARATRRRILATAHRLLLDGGYAAMTVATLARETGVSVQTVYNSVGKAASSASAPRARPGWPSCPQPGSRGATASPSTRPPTSFGP